MDLDHKIKENIWDHINDFLKVYTSSMNGEWKWYKNSKCKYVELRIDMRDGGCLIKDRDGNRITPEILAWQYSEESSDL